MMYLYCGTYIVEVNKVITTMVIGSLDLLLLGWGLGKSCTIVYCIA